MASFSNLPVPKPRQNVVAERVKQEDESLARKTASDTDPATAARGFRTYRTDVKVYILSTGDDAGGNSEINGYIRFFNVNGTGDTREDRLVLADKQAFAPLNGGRGIEFLRHSRETVGMPASFTVYLYESDRGPDQIIENAIWDYTDPRNIGSMDGTLWSWVFKAPFETRYTGSVTFQVTETTVAA